MLCVALAIGVIAAAAVAIRNAGLALPAAPFGVPTSAPATPTAQASTLSSDAVPSDPRALVVPATDLGPDWTTRRESTAGSTPILRVYEVDYANAGDTVSPSVGFSLFSARSTVDADSGMQQLRQSAEARGVAFEPFPSLGTDQPSLRGRATLDGSPSGFSVVHLFRIEDVVAVVEVIGPPDQEVGIGARAEQYARLQRDRLMAALHP